MRDTRPLTPRRIEVVDDKVAEILRKKTETERLAITFGMNRSMRRMISGVLKSEHPDWSESDVASEIARRVSSGSR